MDLPELRLHFLKPTLDISSHWECFVFFLFFGVFSKRTRITAEDKVAVRTGGLAFASSPTAAITESLRRNRPAFLLIGDR